ncbi:hypothetical protein CK203_007109 [Vitis vinifera]|uniref:J domain-containing protein n=1 Tax=Vitis vinifera TaxID=29760 RepID=A0A438KCX2_VITVI|nr:hypothetical protein CK203_007109 [Vitis vinifera]
MKQQSQREGDDGVFGSLQFNPSDQYRFKIVNCRDRTGEEPKLSDSSAYAVLGVDPSCSAAELKAAFQSQNTKQRIDTFCEQMKNQLSKGEVKQFHPDVNKEGGDSDKMIRLVIQAYESPLIEIVDSSGLILYALLSCCSRSEIIERECLDPFDEPECEAFDLFVNEVLCVGNELRYRAFFILPGLLRNKNPELLVITLPFRSCVAAIARNCLASPKPLNYRKSLPAGSLFLPSVVKRTPLSNIVLIEPLDCCPYSCVNKAPHAFTFVSSTGTARATSQLAVGQCPRSCIHYVTPSQRIVLEELLDSILDTPYDTSAEADLLYSLIVKARFENNRYQKPKNQPKGSTQHVDWF